MNIIKSESSIIKRVFAAAVCAVTVFSLCGCDIMDTEDQVTHQMEKTAQMGVELLKNQIDRQIEMAEQCALSLSYDPDSVAGIQAYNRAKSDGSTTEQAEQACLKRMKEFHDQTRMSTDNMTCYDATGSVIIRSFSDCKGDSLMSYDYMQAAINENMDTTAIVTGTAIPLGVRSCVPVNDPETNEVIGAVTVTYDLADPDILTRLGDEDTDFMIIMDGRILNSTIHGTVGTEINKDAADKLSEGETYTGKEMIGETVYIGVYEPIMDDGYVLGALWAGIH